MFALNEVFSCSGSHLFFYSGSDLQVTKLPLGLWRVTFKSLRLLPSSYRNHKIDFLCKSFDRFLYKMNTSIRYVKQYKKLQNILLEFEKFYFPIYPLYNTLMFCDHVHSVKLRVVHKQLQWLLMSRKMWIIFPYCPILIS